MRLATEADIFEIVEMGRRFHESVKPKWPLDKDGLSQVIRALITAGYVARTDKGFIAGTLQSNPISRDWVIASEFLWWSEDGSGARLQRGFRKWARDHGAKEIRWSCPCGSDRVRKHYERIAEQTEIIYSEYLPCA